MLWLVWKHYVKWFFLFFLFFNHGLLYINQQLTCWWSWVCLPSQSPGHHHGWVHNCKWPPRGCLQEEYCMLELKFLLTMYSYFDKSLLPSMVNGESLWWLDHFDQVAGREAYRIRNSWLSNNILMYNTVFSPTSHFSCVTNRHSQFNLLLKTFASNCFPLISMITDVLCFQVQATKNSSIQWLAFLTSRLRYNTTTTDWYETPGDTVKAINGNVPRKLVGKRENAVWVK